MVAERAVPSPRPQDPLGEPADDIAAHLAGVEQHEVVDDHAVLEIAEPVDQLGRVRAPATDDGHLGPHAAQRNIRACPTPPTPTRPCWRSTGAAPRPTSVLVSHEGAVLGRARVGPSNHQLVGLDGMLDALTEAVTAVRRDAGLPALTPDRPLCPTGVYCLAGIDLPVDEEKLAPAIAATGWTEQTILRNDTFAVSRAGTTSAWGIGLVCGTGMNCAAVGPDGRTVRFPALAELSGDFAPGGVLARACAPSAWRCGPATDAGGPTSLQRAGACPSRRKPTPRRC